MFFKFFFNFFRNRYQKKFRSGNFFQVVYVPSVSFL